VVLIRLLRRIRYLVHQRRANSDLAEEIEFHRELKQKELERSGLPRAEAQSESRRMLGNLSIAREDARAVWVWPAVDQLARDARIGARMLVKTPLFTIFAALVLSIGIGANVMVFTYLNAIFLKPLQVPEPDRVVRIYGDAERSIGIITYQEYKRYRDANQSFSSIGMYFIGRPIPIRLQGARAIPIDMMQPTITSASLFKTVGLQPAIGRNIGRDDEYLGAEKVAMLNEIAWRQYFGADPNIVGRTIFINNTAHTIIGVVTGAFEGVFHIIPTAAAPHVFLPAGEETYHDDLSTFLVGRLQRGVTRTEAQADLSRIASQLSTEKKFRIAVSVEPSNQPPSWLWVALASLIAFFMVGVLVVLLIACDDIAILLMARITARQREMGIRLALGANRAQLVPQLVAENLMLAALGGMGAMVFALLSARAFEHLPFQLPIPDSYRLTMDWRVLLFTTVTALATTLFFGLRPSLQCASRDVVTSINPGALPGNRSSRIRSSLITTQVTVCTALLITAAVLVRSTQSSLSDYRGFTADHVLLGSINFMGSGYDREMQRSFYERLMTRLNETPGIVSACVADSLPIALPAGDFFRFGGFFGRYVVRSDSRNEEVQVSTNAVSRGYFATLRIPLIQGRDFIDRDDMNAPKVGIINDAMARRLWPNENPVGRILRGEDGETIEVIGVAGNIRYEEERVAPLLYRPISQKKDLLPNTILIRTVGEPMLAAALVQGKIGEIDPNLLAYNLHTLKDRLARALLPYRIFAYAAGIPGLFTLLLGVIGTYGTMALVVSQRRREIGIRIALGAHPSRAVALMTREGMKWTSAGLFLGIIGALFIALWLSRNFYGLHFFDPIAFSAVTLLVAGIAGMASYIPARRASRVDPLKVLRED